MIFFEAIVATLIQWVKNNWRVLFEISVAVAGILFVAHLASNAIERKVAARTAKQVALATKALQSEVTRSHQRETGLIKKIDSSDTLIASLKKEVEHAPVVVFAKPRTPSRSNDLRGSGASAKAQNLECSSRDDGAVPVLSTVAVRVLDSARLNTDLGATSGSDAEVGTPSDVTVSEFVENDLEVVRLYQRLAARHDELVDYVENKLKLPLSSSLKSK